MVSPSLKALVTSLPQNIGEDLPQGEHGRQLCRDKSVLPVRVLMVLPKMLSQITQYRCDQRYTNQPRDLRRDSP